MKTPKLGIDLSFDSIQVHFVHGTSHQSICQECPKRIGKELGGHVEIQIDTFFYGFNYNSIPISLIPKPIFNSKVDKLKLSDWRSARKNDMVTSIKIPVSSSQKTKLNNYLAHNHIKPKYDYAILGHRCASMTAKWLSEAGIIDEINNFEAVLSAFHPQLLRKTLIRMAQQNDYPIALTFDGNSCCEWEKLDSRYYEEPD